MPGLLADISVQGQVEILRHVLESEYWRDVWASVDGSIVKMDEVGLAREAPDVSIWRLCQERGLILVTANRNSEGDDSLESTIRREGTADSLPVFTLADQERIRHSGEYAERVVIKILEHLFDLDNLRGAGRIYLP